MSRYSQRQRFGLRRRQTPPSVIDNQFSPETKNDVIADINGMIQDSSPDSEPLRMSNKLVDVRYVVKYPMFGDLPGDRWLQIVGDAALKAGLIKGYRMLYVGQSAFGLQNVLFLIDATVVVGDYTHIYNDGVNIASSMVGEMDVEILGIELI